MPAQYDRIKQSMMGKGMDEDEAQMHASKIFIAKGKGGSRSSRAKSLHVDKKRRKPKANYPMPKRK